MSFLFGALLGLVVGWFLLPKPQWAQNLWNKAKTEVDTAVKAAATPPSANT